MATQLSNVQTDEVLAWIDKQAQRHHISVTTFSDGIIVQGNWVNVPITVNQGEDAFERATLLQQIEDEWDPDKFGGVNLLLVPAKRSQPS